MRGNILNNKIWIILCCLFALAGCKAHKQLMASRQPVMVAPEKNTGSMVSATPAVNTKLIAIRAKQLAFNTFSGKAKTSLNIDGNGNDVTLNVRIQHDKKIWVSVTALLGIEAARALITPDSIIIINRLQGLYIKKPFSYINQYAGKQVNYQTLEALLVGNAIPQLLNENADISADNANTVISGSLQSLLYKLTIGPDFKVSQTNLTNQQDGQNLQVTNSAFIQADTRVMPSQIDIASAVEHKKIQISLHYNTADFDKQLEYPFSIPDRFTPVN